ncbi:hypothetical protein TSUD_354830 [Trifolium subterraneum]|uniref:TIR domain-containing protein n=1 Tax=Trifolium subterraneum TaxID=3900 RepID=A0A2Z6MFZ3_TRISU|nr:hypothetical protein TSUD_354830 [Trifolium subterraneum]
MASSSSSSSNSRWIHDVFINFRGQDTRKNIVSHLYAALSNAGINTFLDNEKLRKGRELGPQLLRAVEVSQIAIVVFSKSYTESSWCLVLMNYQKGAFGRSLKSTAKRRISGLPEFKLRKDYMDSGWRNALTVAANFSGWDVNNCRTEGELVKKIVGGVFTKLEGSFLSIAEFSVGLEPRMLKVVKFIENQSSNVCMIGIWGMGGSGKTTAAKAIYNRIHRKFGHISFVENIREACENNYYRGIIQLQKKILSDVLKTKEKIDSIGLGTNKMEDENAKMEKGYILSDVHQKLRISYNGLEDDLKKDIFLDICFFFIGKDRAYVTEILNGCGLYADIGISVLIERSLLKVEKNNKLQMHDLIRDMGREIVRQKLPKEPGKRSRLLFHEDVCHVLTKNTGTNTVEGLILNLQRTGRVNISTNAFQEMNKLRLLQLDRVDLIGDFGVLSNQLRWVNWQRFSFKCIPDDFYQENLVVFELKYSNVRQVWKETRIDKLEEDIVQMESLTTLIAEITAVTQVPFSVLDVTNNEFLTSYSPFWGHAIVSSFLGLTTQSQILLARAYQRQYTHPSMGIWENYPSWLAYTCVGPSVYFQVPEDSDCGMKGITLCVVYSSTLENMATECLTSLLIINYTKFTIQIYKRDAIMSFNDENWHGVVSNLGVGDNVEIFVAFGHGLTVKETGVYLIYGQSTAMEIESSIIVEVEPILEVEVQVQPSPDVENQLLPKPNEKVFTRLAKRVGECLCLSQN